MDELINIEITREIILKLFREKSCYSGFAWIGVKELVGTDNSTITTDTQEKYYFMIFKQLITGHVYGTLVRITTGHEGIGYTSLIEKTSRITDLEEK